MTISTSQRRFLALAASTITLTSPLTALAGDEAANFATGAYATRLRTHETHPMNDTGTVG